MRHWKFGFLACVACGGGESKGTDTDSANTAGDADTDADSDTDVDTDADADTDPVTGCYDVPIIVDGGYGDVGYSTLADGDGVSITHGVQGGWHISTALQVDRIHQQAVILPTVTLVSTGQVISGFQGEGDLNLAYVTLIPTGECSGEAWGVRAFLNDFTPDAVTDDGFASQAQICDLEGQEVTIAWTVTDLVVEGRSGTDSVNVFLTVDPYDVELCEAL